MINVIPKPRVVKEKEGTYALPESVIGIKYADSSINFRQCVACALAKMSIVMDEPDITFWVAPKLVEEQYVLKVTEGGIKVYAADYSGFFYALVTLRQLADKSGKVPCCEIYDKPEYSWRGVQLDESRHFFGADTVRKLLDFMAQHKLNRFHWHLTDDQGWRIEIKKYPLLTEIGSKRSGTQLHNWNCSDMDNEPHEGYYTQDEIKQILAYAKARGIEIVPEIDFPAHCSSALASYNDLACREMNCEVPSFFGGKVAESKGYKGWGRTLCLGKDETVQFAFDVIEEVAELFPFNYFHVGGDEAPTNEWKNCSKCQARMKAEGLKNETALQGWFTNKLNAYLKSLGKTMIGWNEVLAAKNIDSDVVAQYWTPKKDGNVEKHLKKNGKVILSNHKYFYFDMLHTYCTVKGTYNFDIKNAGLSKKYADSVIGVEGENWTEWTASEDELFFKLTNRTLALAETGWNRSKDYRDFMNRLQAHKANLDKMDINYGEDWLTLEKNQKAKKKAAKKNGFSLKDFDSEYRLSMNA